MDDTVLACPNIWSDGTVDHFDVEVAGARVFTHATRTIRFDGKDDGCSGVCSSAFGSMQTVQRAEYWSVIQALRACSDTHIGIHNLNVWRGVAKLIDKELVVRR